MNFTMIKIIAVLFLFFIITAKAQDCFVEVSISVIQPDADILVNDSLLGKGNAVFDLEKGSYRIRIVEDELLWNSRSIIDSIIIDDCDEDISLVYNFEVEIFLTTLPEDAQVYSNEKLIGYTPLYISSNLKNIRIAKRGFSEKTFSSVEELGSKIINLDFAGIVNDESFFKRDMFKILLGTLTAFGGISAYFKLKADKKFDEYQITGQKKLLDETRRYDLISGISFGLLQINFGVLIYYFLADSTTAFLYR